MDYIIESERLLLRNFKSTDAVSYYEMTRDTAIQDYVPYAFEPTLRETMETINKYYSQGDFVHDFYIVIEDKETHQMAGAIIATQTFQKTLDMSILTAKRFRGKGYMREALNAFISSLPSGTLLSFDVRADNLSSLKTVTSLRGIQEVKAVMGYRKFIYEV